MKQNTIAYVNNNRMTVTEKSKCRSTSSDWSVLFVRIQTSNLGSRCCRGLRKQPGLWCIRQNWEYSSAQIQHNNDIIIYITGSLSILQQCEKPRVLGKH